MALVLWLVLALTLIVATPIGVNRGMKALHAHKHARCLANIERIEIELGWRPAPARVVTAEAFASRWAEGIARAGVQAWKAGSGPKAANYTTGLRSASGFRYPALTQVRRAVQEGQISSSQGFALLRRMGYSATVAAALLPKPHPPRHGGQTVAAAPEPASTERSAGSRDAQARKRDEVAGGVGQEDEPSS